MMYFLPAYNRGIFNRYRKGMPWPEMLSKDALALWYTFKPLLRGKRVRRILCYPHFPSRGATIYKIARTMGWDITNKPTRPHDLAIYWEYATIRSEWQVLENIRHTAVINLHSRNISKDYVDLKMNEVFGYCTSLSPTQHSGLAVRKSLRNAVHDGMIVQCPVEPEPGFFYQRLVDSSVSDSEVMDIRVPVMKNEIPHVYRNYRPVDQRFVNIPPRSVLETNPDACLSSAEQGLLIALARALGMEYCEFDVLRDRGDGRIYVVDANNTPQGPPKKTPPEEKQVAVKRLAEAFRRQFPVGASSSNGPS